MNKRRFNIGMALLSMSEQRMAIFRSVSVNIESQCVNYGTLIVNAQPGVTQRARLTYTESLRNCPFVLE